MEMELQKINLLYIEGDATIQKLIMEMLKKEKHNEFVITQKNNLEECMKTLNKDECNFDIVLLDLMLSNSQGIDTYKKVRSLCEDIPIVIISEYSDIACQCVQLGAQDYIIKTDITPRLIVRSLLYSIERNKIRRQLEESERRFKLLTDASFEGVVISRNATIIDINKQFCNILDVEKEDIIGKKVTEFVSEGDKELVLNNLNKNYETPYEHIALRKDGTEFPVEVHGKTLPNGLRITAIRDMTRYKKAELELRLRKDLYEELVEATGASIYEIDYKKMKFIYVNDVLCKVTGWTREQLMLMNPSDLLTKEGFDEFIERMTALERGDVVPETHEYEIIIKDGSSRWAIINTEFKKDKDNKVIGASVVAIDITQQKKFQEEARRKEELIFKELEVKIKEWKEEISLKSIATENKLEQISLNINSISNSEVQ